MSARGPVVPIEPGKKGTTVLGWSEPWYAPGAVPAGWNQGQRMDGVTGVDCDCQEAVDWWTEHGPGTPYVTESRPGHRVYWYIGESPWRGHWALPDGTRAGEVRTGAGNYCVIPPSVHPETGESYYWLGPDLFEGSGPAVPRLPARALPPRYRKKLGGEEVTDFLEADWGDRLPAEDCPGSGHAVSGAGDLGVQIRDGLVYARCWVGCDFYEVVDKLVADGRYTRDELWPPVGAGDRSHDAPWELDIAREQAEAAALLGIEFIDDEPEASEDTRTRRRLGGGVTRMTRAEFQARVDTDFLDEAVLSVTDILNLPPIEWLPGLEGLLQAGVTSAIAGSSGSGKSLWTLQHCVDLALRGRRVVYCALEGRSGFNGRLRAQLHEQLLGLPGSLHAAREADLLETLGGNLYWYDLRIALYGKDTEASVARLRRALQLLGAEVVVVDTLIRAAPGVDENDNSQMQAVIDQADVLRYREDVSVWLLHHAGHDQNRARGASSIGAALDNLVFVSPVSAANDGKDGRPLVVRVRSDKVKDGGQAAGLVYRKHEVMLGTLRNGQPWTSVVFRRDEDASLGGLGLGVDEAQVLGQIDRDGGSVTSAQVREATQWGSTKVGAVLKSMVEEGTLERAKAQKGSYDYFRPGNDPDYD